MTDRLEDIAYRYQLSCDALRGAQDRRDEFSEAEGDVKINLTFFAEKGDDKELSFIVDADDMSIFLNQRVEVAIEDQSAAAAELENWFTKPPKD